ncbi:MAG TPA: phosphohistidine phosphatase SixA [Longimicrobiales bacterium]|nr:phosphohistidine phosphatase SixA [Longimicrobiales bacterium]
MRLYLVRHADAKSKDEDPERRLSERGSREIESLARRLRAADEVAPVRILHSGKARARESAEGLARELGVREVVEDAEALAPNADPAAWDDRLKGPSEDLMLVGHLPHVARLVGYLVEGDPDAEPVSFRTGTTACLEDDDSGAWRVLWAQDP